MGGIVGYGCEVYQCVSLVSVKESEGYTGSVAGEWDREDGVLAGNRFVEGPLAGVDGISYAGQAEPVAYASLIQEAGVPLAFRSLTVSYVAEDELLETVSYSYGQLLTDLEVPAVPEKPGYYGVWEEIGESRVTIDHVVEAVYTPYTTTLASSAMRDSVHPVFLVEGIFGGGAALRAEQTGGDDDAEQWRVTLTRSNDREHRVRFTPPAEWKRYSLSLLADGKKYPVQWEQDGSCCVFTVSGTGFTIEAARQAVPFPVLWLLLAAGCAAAAAACAFLLWKRRRKKMRRSLAAHQ